MTVKQTDQEVIRPSKQYPKNSLHYRQYQALKKYYGGNFNEIFFQAAWAVLGPLGSALNGASFSEIQKLSTAGKHLLPSRYKIEGKVDSRNESDTRLPREAFRCGRVAEILLPQSTALHSTAIDGNQTAV